MALENRRAEDEGVRVEQPRSEPNLHQVHVGVDHLRDLVLLLLVEVDQRDLVRAILGDCLRIAKVLIRVPRLIPRRFGDHNRATEARSQVIENSAQRVGVCRAELVLNGHTVRLDQHVAFAFKRRPDLLVDGEQRLVNILPAVITVDQGDGGAVRVGRQRLRAGGSGAGEHEESAAGQFGWHVPEYMRGKMSTGASAPAAGTCTCL